MAVQQTPLDEIQWKAPPIAQSMGGIHSNTVLPYFSHSPFFDPTSNNATLTTQATYNPQMFHLIQTREAFEGRLRTMQGLEFVVAFDPTQPSELGPEANGAWIIRKQTRRKRHGLEDEITVQATYFVIGENVYMAPSVASVLSSRLLSTVTSLTKFLSTASSLPLFSPTYGYTYMPIASKTLPSVPSSQASQKANEDDVEMPDASNVSSRIAAKEYPSTNTALTNFQDSRTLSESYALSNRYQNDYMDESPLTGEPGSFILSSTTGQKETQSQSTVKQPAKPAVPTPKLNTTSATATATSKKNTGAVKEKSPTSPAKPKRRKSKAAISPTE